MSVSLSAVFLAVCLLAASVADLDRALVEGDGLPTKELGRHETETGSNNVDIGVANSWGLEDRIALVGRLFEYQLAKVELGTVDKVSDVEHGELPGWLHFDAEKTLLEGVPGADSLGKTFQVQVTFTGLDGDRKKLTSIDTFEIRVADESSSNQLSNNNRVEFGSSSESDHDNTPRPIRCLPGSAVTTAAVIIDADLKKMTGAERSALIRNFGAHLDLPVTGLRLMAASSSTPIDDGSALVAGAGNVQQTSLEEERPRAIVQWEVGCGNVFAAHMSVLQRVETNAQDGSMAAAIRHDVIGWHVANKKPVSATRLRRQAPRVHATATPTVSIAPPTKQPGPTQTIKNPEPTKAATVTQPVITTRPTAKQPKPKPSTASRPMTTPRLTRPPKTPKERTQRPSTLSTSTMISTKSSTVTVTHFERLEPSVAIESSSPRMTDLPTPPIKITATIYPPLVWTGKFQRLEASVNEIVDRELPADAFMGGDPNGHLTFELLTEDGLEASTSWLKLNKTSRRFFGMPLESQSKMREYIVKATDRAGHSARGVFVAEVKNRLLVSRPAYESSATLDVNYDTFCDDDGLRLDVANKIAGAFGDPDARHLAITRVQRGSVILAWTNSSMSGDVDCPEEQIAAIQSKMFNPDGTVSSSFTEAIQPYKILGIEMMNRGSCGNNSVRATPGAAPVVARPEPSVVPGGGSMSTTTGSQMKSSSASSAVIIIVLIVVAVIIIVLIVVCCLVRCHRNRKKSASPDKKIKSGAPIILAYELDNMDSSMTPSKPLIGAGTDRPPAPPDYQLATGGPNGASPPTEQRRHLLSSDPTADQMSPLRYQPPPGSATSRGAQPPAGQRRPPAYTAAT